MKKFIMAVMVLYLSPLLFAAAPSAADHFAAALQQQAQAAAQQEQAKKIYFDDLEFVFDHATKLDPENGITEYAKYYKPVSPLPKGVSAMRLIAYHETNMKKLHEAGGYLPIFVHNKLVSLLEENGGGGITLIFRNPNTQHITAQSTTAHIMHMYPADGGFLHRLSIQRSKRTEKEIIRYVLEFDVRAQETDSPEQKQQKSEFFDDFFDKSELKHYITHMGLMPFSELLPQEE